MTRAASRVGEGRALFTPKEAPERAPPKMPEPEQHARRIVWRRMEEARAIKRRVVAGEAFPWEIRRLASLVHEARLYHHQALTARARPMLPADASGPSYKAVSIKGNTDRDQARRPT